MSEFQIKTKDVLNRLIPDSEGVELEQRTVFHRGKFYLVIKIRNKWRYFQEVNIAQQ